MARYLKDKMKKTNSVHFLLIFCFTLVAVSPIYAASSESLQQPLKVGFVCVGPVNDWGWNYAHDLGRKFLEASMHGKVTTTLVENIPESAEVERVVEKMIAHGCKLIFTTSYGYLEPTLRVAARHPDVIFMQSQRVVPSNVKNVGTYFGRQYEPMYVAGVVAARMTKKNKLGYVGGHPVPPIVACLNAFALGARSINPKLQVKAVWTNSWADPATETEATASLIDSGADVIACQLDGATTVVKTCEQKRSYGIGCNADLGSLGYKAWLTGQKWNWGPLYVKITQSVIDHTWKPANSIYTMKDGYVGLSSFGPAVPPEVKKEADAITKKIIDGKLIIFKGPLKDSSGQMRVNAGQVLTDKDLREIDYWVVDGVQASLPKK